MGSEMCIRDSHHAGRVSPGHPGDATTGMGARPGEVEALDRSSVCLLYTSDAADERSSVDLGGRRIIKKKKSREDGRDDINSTIKTRSRHQWK